jgi:hypothetical protein
MPIKTDPGLKGNFRLRLVFIPMESTIMTLLIPLPHRPVDRNEPGRGTGAC